MEGGAEVSDPETAGKIKSIKRDSIADVTTLDIKSRLSLESTEACGEQPHVNGVVQVNGICDSPQRTAAGIADLPPQSKTMETSHLNQHGIYKRQLNHGALVTIDKLRYITIK